MKELTEKQLKFYSNWKERRNKKFQFFFLKGIVYWGIPMGILSFIFDILFSKENISLTMFLIKISSFSIGGLFVSLILYKTIDKRFLKLIKENKI